MTIGRPNNESGNFMNQPADTFFDEPMDDLYGHATAQTTMSHDELDAFNNLMQPDNMEPQSPLDRRMLTVIGIVLSVLVVAIILFFLLRDDGDDISTTNPETDNLNVNGVADVETLAVGENPDLQANRGLSEVPPNGSIPPVTSSDGAATGDTSGARPTAGGGQPSEGNNNQPQAQPIAGSGDYRSNLDLILGATVRNNNHDSSAHINTPSASLTPSNHYGPRQEYLGNPAGNPEQAFPIAGGGQFRTACEFSHFAYDDPLVFPGAPGASHLHMYFGNTHVNAHSTWETLLNSGSSTCNGQELNRTGYWVPAMFDGSGNVRIPERVVIYYKGEGLAKQNATIFPDRAAMIAKKDINTVGNGVGGAQGKVSFQCSNNFSAPGNGDNKIPSCDGNYWSNTYGAPYPETRMVLEMNVKFPQCFNPSDDPAEPDSFRIPSAGGWYYSQCESGDITLPNLEYFVNYVVEPGENTSGWYLASDIDPTTFQGPDPNNRGGTVHGDWWGGWHKETNQQFIDNCVTLVIGEPSGCGMGYLTNGGPDGNNPRGGDALKYRPQYEGPFKVAAKQLYEELCPQAQQSRPFSKDQDAAYCDPTGDHSAHMGR